MSMIKLGELNQGTSAQLVLRRHNRNLLRRFSLPPPFTATKLKTYASVVYQGAPRSNPTTSNSTAPSMHRWKAHVGAAFYCFRCGGPGHFAKACREPLRCFRCGDFGHKQVNCSDFRASHSNLNPRALSQSWYSMIYTDDKCFRETPFNLNDLNEEHFQFCLKYMRLRKEILVSGNDNLLATVGSLDGLFNTFYKTLVIASKLLDDSAMELDCRGDWDGDVPKPPPAVNVFPVASPNNPLEHTIFGDIILLDPDVTYCMQPIAPLSNSAILGLPLAVTGFDIIGVNASLPSGCANTAASCNIEETIKPSSVKLGCVPVGQACTDLIICNRFDALSFDDIEEPLDSVYDGSSPDAAGCILKSAFNNSNQLVYAGVVKQELPPALRCSDDVLLSNLKCSFGHNSAVASNPDLSYGSAPCPSIMDSMSSNRESAACIVYGDVPVEPISYSDGCLAVVNQDSSCPAFSCDESLNAIPLLCIEAGSCCSVAESVCGPKTDCVSALALDTMTDLNSGVCIDSGVFLSQQMVALPGSLCNGPDSKTTEESAVVNVAKMIDAYRMVRVVPAGSSTSCCDIGLYQDRSCTLERDASGLLGGRLASACAVGNSSVDLYSSPVMESVVPGDASRSKGSRRGRKKKESYICSVVRRSARLFGSGVRALSLDGGLPESDADNTSDSSAV